MYTISYSRENVELNELGIVMSDNNFIYYYEIVNIKVSELYGESPSIIIYTRTCTVIRICYDSEESRTKLENELNYFISSVLED